MFSQEVLTKRIEKVFDLANTGELIIDTKYGNVSIYGWEQQSVQIIANIKVTNKKREKAEALLDRIEPVFKSSTDYVMVTSEISKKSASLISRYFKKVNPFEFDRGNINIDYTIYLPMNAEIDVTNKFGDVVIDNWSGKLNVAMEHGDLWINSPISSADVTMKFGKLKAKAITSGLIDLKNGSIDIKEAQELVLKTSGSNIEIDHVNDLELMSSKDEVVIDYAGSLEGDVKFSNMQLGQVDNKIDLYLKVVDFRVSKINQEDAQVNIDQESSDINIKISGLSFKFDATLEEGLLRLPRTFSNIKNTVLDKGSRLRNIKASYGTEPNGVFTFTGKKGVIILKE